jgi:acyl-CoA reductase-like NAD-dependent aldehyde dehydrogenase
MSTTIPASTKVTSSIELPRRYGLLVDGQWIDASDNGVFERHSPADGRLVGEYADASVADVERAIAVARREFDGGGWRETPAPQKAAVLLAAAQLARERGELLAEIVAWEVGKPLDQARGEVNQLVAGLEFCAGAVYQLRGESITEESPSGIAMVVHEPVGVVAAIPSYNFPINLITAKVPYALAAGCSVVLKASELAVGTAFEVARLFLDAGLPAGALQVISTTSLEASRTLVRSDQVDKVAFTGSTATGRSIMRDGADTVKRLTLELGGKGPIVVFDDADLDAVERVIFNSIFLVAGQVCTAGSRLVVHESIHDEMVLRARRVAEAVRVGHPLLSETTMGPVATEGQLEKVLEHIQWAHEDGSVLVHGGHRLTGDGFDGGFYLAPTVFDRVDPTSRLGQEEVFGPVLAISTFRTDEEAIEIANGTQYGLKATVWTRDSARLLRIVKAVKHGMVFGNTAATTVPQVGMPFGGYKQSGIGREYGKDGLFSFTETKSVYIKL